MPDLRCFPLKAEQQLLFIRTEGALRSTGKHIPRAPESMSRLFILTFVWLFEALVSMRAIDYDLQEIFWDLAVYGKVFKKIFRERARPGDGRSSTSSVVRSWKSGFCWDTGLITQRLRLVIMAFLDVFGMD